MSKKFPEYLIIDEWAKRETDMNDNEHVWIPSRDRQSQWLRMSIRANAQPTNLGNAMALALRIHSFRNEQVGLLRTLLRRREENAIDAPLGNGGANVSVVSTGASRTALMVWAKDTGVHLDETTIQELFPERRGMVQLHDVWIVDTELNRSANTELQQEVHALGDRLCDQMKEHGTVVADINAEKAERLCFCFMQNHGVTEPTLEKAIEDPSYGYQFIRHRNSIDRAQMMIASQVGYEHTHFFLENYSQSPEELLQSLAHHAQLRSINSLQRMIDFRWKIECNANERENAFQNCYDNLKQGLTDSAGDAFQLLCGGDLAIRDGLRSGHNLSRTVHGLAFSRGEQAQLKVAFRKVVALCQEEGAPYAQIVQIHNEMTREHLLRLHPILIGLLEQSLSVGEVGIIVLGSKHFKSCSSTPRMLHDASVESHAERSPSLGNLRLIMIEPHGLCELHD
ncbi:MAG: hypothetical protein PHH13_01825 [Candidatus Peribacteraceae bacterium]|nr:hypothetical protein [Candidatus Peribacteraceae bacterium]